MDVCVNISKGGHILLNNANVTVSLFIMSQNFVFKINENNQNLLSLLNFFRFLSFFSVVTIFSRK
jgi:hypothetical protein